MCLSVCYLYVYILFHYLYILYCTLLRNDYMYLYLLYVLLVYIRSLSFFLLVCSCTLVHSLYRHTVMVFVCCVYQVILYMLTMCFASMLCLCLLSRVRWRSVRPLCSVRFEGLRVPLRACRLRPSAVAPVVLRVCRLYSVQGLPLVPCCRPAAPPLPSALFAVGIGGGLPCSRSPSVLYEQNTPPQ